MTAPNHEIVSLARQWLETPFIPGARRKGPSGGCDCGTLLAGIYEEYTGKSLPSLSHHSIRPRIGEVKEFYAEELARFGKPVGSRLADAEIGDILLFRIKPRAVARHTGIVVGMRRMIHVLVHGRVCEVEIGQFYENKIVGVFRFPERT